MISAHSSQVFRVVFNERVQIVCAHSHPIYSLLLALSHPSSSPSDSAYAACATRSSWAFGIWSSFLRVHSFPPPAHLRGSTSSRCMAATAGAAATGAAAVAPGMVAQPVTVCCRIRPRNPKADLPGGTDCMIVEAGAGACRARAASRRCAARRRNAARRRLCNRTGRPPLSPPSASRCAALARRRPSVQAASAARCVRWTARRPTPLTPCLAARRRSSSFLRRRRCRLSTPPSAASTSPS